MNEDTGYAIGVDIGGTFTDVVCLDTDNRLRLVKIPTTRGNPSEGVATALRYMQKQWSLDPAKVQRFIHGTTVATNAILEKRGGKVGLLMTSGFRDVLEIGRQSRRAMYDVKLRPQTPVFLAPRAFRKEVDERVSATGEVVRPLNEADVIRVVDELVADGVDTIAVCYLFSFLHPEHEQRTAEIIRRRHPQLMISLSSDVDPTFREYERTCVTAFDAYVKPVLNRYLEDMEQDLRAGGVPAPLQVMQSRGGLASAQVARQRPVRLFLSGPAAGVVGAQMSAGSAGVDDLITVDIGGTSCDIALISRGKSMIRSEGDIDGYPVRVPMVDVNAIGAGGGSIAWIDRGGGLRMGPHSAGSEPGPACYGRGGGDATVTDASIVLGYIDPGYFAGGLLDLKPELAVQIIKSMVADPLGMSIEDAALGIHKVINAQMAEAIRLTTIKRGFDPRKFSIVPLGGGGALHAVALADELAINQVLIPVYPGVLSAIGLLGAPIEHEATASFSRATSKLNVHELRRALDKLDVTCSKLMATENVTAASVEISYHADLCYIGQSYHLEVPFVLDGSDALGLHLHESFRQEHDKVYGHGADAPTTIVNVRAVHRSVHERSLASLDYQPNGNDPVKGKRHIRLHSGVQQAVVYDRLALAAGATIDAGPAIFEQADTTALMPPGWRAKVDASGTLVLTRIESSAT